MPSPKKPSADLKLRLSNAVEAMALKGTQIEAARYLGISRQTLQSRLRDAGWVAPPRAARAPSKPEPSQTVANRMSASVTSPVELQAKIEKLEDELAAVTQVKRWVASERKKKVAPKGMGKKLIFVPDLQIKEGVPLQHLRAIGNYIADKKPDNVVFAGDNADMPSLSSWDRGKLCFEGRRYRSDVQSHNDGMSMLMEPINRERSKGNWEVDVDETLGNHEHRILRAVQEDSRLEGLMSINDLQLSQLGITAHEFLKVIVRNGAAFSHYFPRGAPNAKAQLVREGRSAFSGHQQGLDIHCQYINGILQWGVIAGSGYLHDEDYLTPQGNAHWRGIVVAHEMRGDGSLNPMIVSLDYLLDKYS
jgi:DNA-binding XRE family transcriptional regulator